MARKRRMDDGVIRLRANELRDARLFRGIPIHFGRGRPPRGQIGFVEALSQRTGYSRTIIMRVLGARSRSGPRRPATERVREELTRLTKPQLAQVIQSLYQTATKRLEDNRDSRGDPLLDERLDLNQRLKRLIEVLSLPGTGFPKQPEPTGGYWNAPAPIRPPSPSLPSLPTSDLALEALLDALAGALSVPNTITDDETRRVVLILRRRLEQATKQ